MNERTGRQLFREFVRAHHPDRGGDPEVFIAGLARFRELAASHSTDAANELARLREGGTGYLTLYKRRGLFHQLWTDVFTAVCGTLQTRPSRVE
ncbi:MAG: hypothetical protein DLM55_04260 [Acidimicrobiales bacterium]|nr:MAG: hypothetical protein DLM55_04260 [Acidimicrobiales bacterium]